MSNARKVSTDALETLGTILGENEKRDAIHLAVDPVLAGQTLFPGDHITVSAGVATKTKIGKGLGIVDPFLQKMVEEGERFWFVMYPRMVTSLRHVWSHPAFPDELPAAPAVRPKVVSDMEKAESEAWLRDFCRTSDSPSYDKLIALMVNDSVGDDEEGYGYARIEDEYLFFSGADAHGEIPPEFWDHLEVVTGKRFETRPAHFSCSC